MSAADPGLRWGVKRSFLSYLASLPDGAADVVDGALQVAPGLYQWPLEHVEFDPDAGTGELRFAGAVRFRGHLGALAVDIRSPRLVVASDRVSLGIDVAGERVQLAVAAEARPDRHGDMLVWPGIHLQLADDGVAVFDGAYPAGTALDPAAVIVPVA